MLKSCKVIILPTNKAENILDNKLVKAFWSQGKILGMLKEQYGEVCFYAPHESGGSLTSPLERNFPDWKPQHLYLVSDGKIQEGDYVIINTGGKDTIAQVHNDPKNEKGHYWKEQDCFRCRFISNNTSQYIDAKYCKKIIATTDSNLTYIFDEITFKHAQIPQLFIQQYVEKNGKIDEVLVEYEEIGEFMYIPTLKLQDNEVIICEDKTYTRDEVKEFFAKFITDFPLHRGIQILGSELSQWIEENLN